MKVDGTAGVNSGIKTAQKPKKVKAESEPVKQTIPPKKDTVEVRGTMKSDVNIVEDNLKDDAKKEQLKQDITEIKKKPTIYDKVVEAYKEQNGMTL